MSVRHSLGSVYAPNGFCRFRRNAKESLKVHKVEVHPIALLVVNGVVKVHGGLEATRRDVGTGSAFQYGYGLRHCTTVVTRGLSGWSLPIVPGSFPVNLQDMLHKQHHDPCVYFV